ncbi:DUF2231 domain-containing protein [Planosporangium flavigriseum]|uniref:DUF2231 domain-containing protein n=1 Tax=Planosporangium flavigriseum TaxID=373681 RepID=A0A8J3PNP7_9ACTN|nr:DUF2231 domain-containing protein [Planosporangium flavigriseum]NJC67915.1 DUF2231 domain-containing protein [Planosporangium flavigriseum]GIG76816.1 hypothetical protein Pfl04_52200 [Planosporangium flavigriseum]
MDQAKHPVTALAGPYGHPLHPALVAVPIGAWIASFIFDLASHFVRGPQFLTQGSRWLIGIGVLGALTAAMVGFLDLFAIPTGTRTHRTALVHMSINLVVTAAYAANFVVRGSPAAGGPVGWGPLALSAASLAALAVAGYLGGELAYRYGVRVADETIQAAGYHTPTPYRETADKENV